MRPSKPQSKSQQDDIEKALLLGLANHTNEFLNPGFIPGMSHEDLAKVLDRIMNSRLPERIEALLDRAVLSGRIEEHKYIIEKYELMYQRKTPHTAFHQISKTRLEELTAHLERGKNE